MTTPKTPQPDLAETVREAESPQSQSVSLIVIATILVFGALYFAREFFIPVALAALLVGDQGMYKTIESFGFGRPTGIDLPGESAGILHRVERWGLLEKDYIAFGQGVPRQASSGPVLHRARFTHQVTYGGTRRNSLTG